MDKNVWRGVGHQIIIAFGFVKQPAFLAPDYVPLALSLVHGSSLCPVRAPAPLWGQGSPWFPGCVQRGGTGACP